MVSGYRKRHLPTGRRIPDEVWNEVRRILPSEKPSNTKGRPPVSYRKVLDGILYVLRTGVNGRCYPMTMALVLHVIEGSSSG